MKYEGTFQNDKFHGTGTMTLANSTIYSGDWVDGMYSGNGILKFADGNVYEGGFLNDKAEG